MHRTLVVAVNGAARAGKDTLVDETIKELRKSCGLTASKHSSVDLVKVAASYLGWGGEKDEKGRQFLSDLKDLSTKVYDGPLRYMNEAVVAHNRGVMFFHIREPEEIKRFLAQHEGSVAVLVCRPGLEEFSNHADQNTENFEYDFTIENEGSLEDLQQKAVRLSRYLALKWQALNPQHGSP